jgi:hypothetical protein
MQDMRKLLEAADGAKGAVVPDPAQQTAVQAHT